MATLAERLEQSRSKTRLSKSTTGELTETKSLQDLAKDAGLAATPTTALGAGLLGASPDQQKMVGTPAQLQASLNQASDPQSDLRASERRGLVRQAASQTEQAQLQKSQDLQNLGNLGQRAQKLIASKLATETARAATTTSGVGAAAKISDPEAVSLLRAASQAKNYLEVQTILDKLKPILGYEVSPEAVPGLYATAVEQVAAAGGKAAEQGLAVQDLLTLPGFEYQPEQLAGLLGIPAQQLAGMSYGDFLKSVDTAIATEQQRIQQQYQATGGGLAEQRLSRQAGREASKVGVRQILQSYDQLQRSIDSADTVQFAGQAYKVQDLLRSDNVSNLITNYLLAAPGSPEAISFEQSAPELAEFVGKHRTALEQAVQSTQAQSSVAKSIRDIENNPNLTAEQKIEELSKIDAGARESFAKKDSTIQELGQLKAKREADAKQAQIAGIESNSSLTDQQKYEQLLTLDPVAAQRVKGRIDSAIEAKRQEDIQSVITNPSLSNRQRAERLKQLGATDQAAESETKAIEDETKARNIAEETTKRVEREKKLGGPEAVKNLEVNKAGLSQLGIDSAEIEGLSDDELMTLGLTGKTVPDSLQNYANFKKQQKQYSKLDPKSAADRDAAMKELLGNPAATWDDIFNKGSLAASARAIGLTPAPPPAALDTDGNGKTDSFELLVNKVRGKYSEPLTLKDIIAGKKPPERVTSKQSWEPVTGADRDLVGIAGGAMRDGVIKAAEFISLQKALGDDIFTVGERAPLLGKQLKPKLDAIQGKNSQELLNSVDYFKNISANRPYLDNVLSKSTNKAEIEQVYTSLADQLAQLRRAGLDQPKYDKTKLSQGISALEADMDQLKRQISGLTAAAPGKRDKSQDTEAKNMAVKIESLEAHLARLERQNPTADNTLGQARVREMLRHMKDDYRKYLDG